MADALRQELETYKKILPTLSDKEGQFALIFGEELVGVYESYADALKAGYDRAGLRPFLVKRISTTEVVAYFTRGIDGACRI